jgi:hypothetical protein
MATWGQAQNATGKPGGFFMRYMHEIVHVAVNDPYMMAAWGQAQNATGKVGGILMRYMHEIFCLAVNNPYVMAAWGQAQNKTGKIGRFLKKRCMRLTTWLSAIPVSWPPGAKQRMLPARLEDRRRDMCMRLYCNIMLR